MQCFEQTGWIAGIVYSVEISGPSKRGLFGCAIHYWWGIGWTCSSGVAYLFPDWVDYSIISAGIVIILIPGVYFIPPSIVYLFRSRKYIQGNRSKKNVKNVPNWTKIGKMGKN